ncbi:MAG: serine hydrolase [Planctomycetes bacterium]|nr:serine hydrolase [Planctomycetota bacterium]
MTTFPCSAALAAALLFSSAAIAQVAYHDVDGAGHQAQWNALSGIGYRPIALSIYGTTTNPQYAAVWVLRAGPTVQGFHGLTAAEYQTFASTWWPLGYRPKILSALGTAANPRFAGTWELTNAPGWTSHGLDEDTYLAERATANDQGLDVTAIDIYGTASDPRYVVAFGPVGTGQTEVISSSVAGFQEHFDALADGHARPALIAFNDSNRFVSLWRSDDVGDCIVDHDMTSAQYQANATAYAMQGLYPISVQGSGSGASRRFAAVFGPSDLPVTPVLTKTGVAVPQFAPFDTWVQNWMAANQTRAASLAIVRDGRLVYARGYTLARVGYPITQPTSLFEIASCTKPITSIVMHQHFARASANMAATDSMLSYFPGAIVQDPRLSQITLHSLLTHQGGWDRNITSDPMVGLDPTIASTLGLTLPIGKGSVRRYVFGSTSLDFTPNTQSQYSNFGFSVLGQTLELCNPGLTYEQIVQRDVFQPLGLVRPRMSGNERSELHPGEVFYHPYTPMLSRSVLDDARPWVAGQYGALNKTNMDSHGGWVMSAPDMAKILAAFDLGASNPLLSPDSTDAMWSVEPGYNTLMNGWFAADVPNGTGGQVRMCHHNGRLYGAVSFIAHRKDGLSFVFLTNGDRNNLSGATHGQQLSDIANTITAWPQNDLFPQYSIPPFVHVAGSIAPIGQSCAGTHGLPTFTVAGTPDVGEKLDFTVGNLFANRIALTALGVQQFFAPLAGIGAPNCWLYTDPIVLLADVSDAVGKAEMTWQTPPSPDSIGLVVTSQGVVLDPGANAAGLITTLGRRITLGGWH